MSNIDNGEQAIVLPLVGSTMTALISAEDAHLACAQWRLGANGYVYKQGARLKGRECLLHRIVAAPGAGQQVHHKNAVRTDCRRGNLTCLSAREHQIRFHSHAIRQKNIASRAHEAEGRCTRCGRVFIKHPDHRGRQKMCSKECAIRRAGEVWAARAEGR